MLHLIETIEYLQSQSNGNLQNTLKKPIKLRLIMSVHMKNTKNLDMSSIDVRSLMRAGI